MSDANPQQEPSMEEILASIRRIISEDDDPSAKQEDAPAEEASEDVLELTEVAEEAQEEPAPPEPEEEPPEEVPEEPVEEELSLDEVLEDVPQEDELELRETVEEPVAAAPEPAPAPAPAPQPVEGGLIAPETATAAAGTLSGLVAAVDRAHGGSALGDGNRTIEDLVKEVMRPMVKDWLDENLPALTERLVRREIERLARHAEDD